MRSPSFLTATLFSISTLVPAFGASYIQDFNSFTDGTTDLGDGSTIISWDGGARVSNGALRLLVDGAGEENSTYRIPGLAGTSNGWSASFTVNLSSTGVPGDGFSFSWGSGIGFYDEPGGSEEGWGIEVDHLYLTFDLFDNGGNEWGLEAGAADGTSLTTFTGVPGPLLSEGESVTGEVLVNWDPVKGLSFRTTGFNTNIDVTDIPTSGFTVDDANLFAFSARTGGATANLSIDNLRIQSVPEPGISSLILLGSAAGLIRKRSRS